MPRLRAFAPLATSDAHTLILGSMPGAASLAAGQYYAHPRNLFWTILGEVLGIAPELPYVQRTRALQDRGFALWDVLGACRRAGSLDARIEPDSAELNDFGAFFASHRRIDRIFFNGATAERYFLRGVLPVLPASSRGLELRRLPSTSPANASIPYADKLAAWEALR
ncbi:MAG: DNA-deoxyinosine glycosylase [Rhodocyclaceae bacterium]|nr:DNA-deoxyinosine glycosylase [Rhodocyclaceae bacterium]